MIVSPIDGSTLLRVYVQNRKLSLKWRQLPPWLHAPKIRTFSVRCCTYFLKQISIIWFPPDLNQLEKAILKVVGNILRVSSSLKILYICIFIRGQTSDIKLWSIFIFGKICIFFFFFFFKWANLGLFFVYFRSFQTNNTIFTTNQCEKMSCPSSIRRRDSNPQPLERESPPITTRPVANLINILRS